MFSASLDTALELCRGFSTIDYDYADNKNKQIAEGFEREVAHIIKLDGKEFTWNERQLIVRSFAMAETEEKSLRTRLQKTSNALEALNKPRRGKKKLTSVTNGKHL